ncbi:hypothetical protein K525DRAFT_245573, partial [Schizophyllum commune Loenen D]
RPHPALTLHPLIDPLSLRSVLDVSAGTCPAIVDVARLVHGVREITGNNRTVSMPAADPERSADGTNGDTLNSSGDALSLNGDASNSNDESARQTTNGQRPAAALFACDITSGYSSLLTTMPVSLTTHDTTSDGAIGCA